MDRLSSLPDHLLSDIISALPIEAAVSTSVLSHRWRYLWTAVTRFHLSTNLQDFNVFAATVNNILHQLSSPLRLHTIHLRFRTPDLNLGTTPQERHFYATVSSWFHRGCGCNTQKIEVFDSYSDGSYCTRLHIQNALLAINPNCSRELVDYDRELGSMIWLPESLFRSENLVELVLNNTLQYKLPDFVVLPKLKKLSLRLFESYRELMTTIFKSLPLLEDLSVHSALDSDDHVVDIAAPNLKIFAIQFMGSYTRAKVLIDAPKLEQISVVGCNKMIFSFVEIPVALFKAKLVIAKVEDRNPLSQMLGLLKGISCVRSLILASLITVDVLDSVDEDVLPTFDNLVHLSFDVNHINLMKKLVIPAWILKKVKTIRIAGIRAYDEKEMVLLEHILSNASVLELLRVFVSTTPYFDSIESEKAIVKALFILPRNSARCEIQYNGVFGSVSTNDFDNQLHPSAYATHKHHNNQHMSSSP